MTAEKYMKGVFGPILKLFGCYSHKDEPIKTSIDLINSGNNPCIFVQGKIVNGDNPKPKVGAVYIEREIKELFLVPIKMTKLRKFRFTDIFNKEPRYLIEFKRPFRHKKFPKDLQPLADDLLKKILS